MARSSKGSVMPGIMDVWDTCTFDLGLLEVLEE